MKLNRRRVVVAITLLGLLAVSTSLVTARDFPRRLDLRAGIHEIGMYTMVVPGTVGRGVLWPIKPLTPTGDKEEGVSLNSSSCATLAPTAPVMELGGTAMATAVPDPIARATSGISKGTGAIDSPLGSFQSTGSDAARVDQLESGLRDLIQRLHQ